ncbi:Sodium/calcium exchanger 2 [Orchesella cincta]|uniref:Sodium/calcium exchanger 2 n=1 Tax=Orchesella cincta TaxID=48709 RepID=A0A1D2MGP2_ORCCI|nr:Sodium/calcium exchanger 2 [Orchesella cincta]
MGTWFPIYATTNVGQDVAAAVGLFLLICYFFVGVAVASDIFMNAIEKICGSTKSIKTTREEEGVVITDTKDIPVWNETVANLTLMALGSSAPEILLSVIEISEGLGQQSPGELGPGTIVGSAAFNLMIISAVCILSLKEGATSRIKVYQVFTFTCVTSVFAYIWMVVVLQWISPDEVELWEAIITLLFFPLLVGISYWADQEFCLTGRPKTKRWSTSSEPAAVGGPEEDGRTFFFGDESDELYDAEGNVDKKALQKLYHKLTEVADLTPEEIASILATKLIQGKQHTRMWYRMQASRGLMGGAKLLPVLTEKLKEVVEVINDSGSHHVRGSVLNSHVSSMHAVNKALVEFQAATFAVTESIGSFEVVIVRTMKEDVGFEVKLESFDGSAKKGSEYEQVSEILKFDPYVLEVRHTVKIINNNQWNPDSNFFLKVSIPLESQEKALTGQTKVMEVIIEDDDKPGKLSFPKVGYVFNDSGPTVNLEVERTGGSDGVVSAVWKVLPGPNCKLIDPELIGKIEFKHGEMKKNISIPLKPHNGAVEGKNESFDVTLSEPAGGAKLGKVIRTTCAISTDTGFKLEITNVMNMALEMNEEANEDITYKEQILEALMPNGGQLDTATKKDWALHIFTFPFKFTFSLIPPPHMCGGWLCFFLALFAVGLLTKLVGDAASAFGRVCRLDPTITAITFVALGTSLPDTFASRIAAMNDKTADNAIGNVTGSNSVNVFLGLGVPWTIAALYYRFTHEGKEPFCVPAGSLTFNVIVFTVCALLAIFVLTLRRYSEKCGRAELGGPSTTKWITASFMIFLWFFYIFLSAVQVFLEKNGYDISIVFKTGDINVPTQCQTLVMDYAMGLPPSYPPSGPT